MGRWCALTCALIAGAVLCLGGFYVAYVPLHRTPCGVTQGPESGTPTAAPLGTQQVSPDALIRPTASLVQSRCRDENCTHPRPRCKQSYSQYMGNSRCPNDRWVGGMVRVDPNPDKVILNIGCNKGHDAIQWLQRFDQQNFWNLGTWAKSMPRGFCSLDSRVPPPPKYESSAVPLAICVEAMPSNVELLKKVRAEKGYEPHQTQGKGRLEILHYAVIDVSSPGAMIEFVDGGEAGKESCGIGFALCPNLKRVQVPSTTVDSIVQSLSLPKVDVLLIDTEGADPAVLRGATETLKSVRYLMFETHRDLKHSDWETHSIYSVVEDLATKGFECYWMGNTGKAYSVTQCYEAAFEKVGMGNIACVKPGDVWYGAMEKEDPNSGFNA